ncbi:MAG: sensor histidine kinase [Acidimicrobiales bacterium]
MTALATVTVLVVLVVAGLVLVAQQRRLLTEALDEGLQERAAELLALGDEVPATITGLGDDDTLAQVLVDDEVLASSDNAAGLPPVASAPERGERILTIDELPHEDGRFRLVSRSDAGSGRVVHVAGPLDDIDESVEVLARLLLGAVPLVVLAVAVVVWWMVGRTLHPVEAIRTEVATITGSDLSRRVPVPAGDDEVARLARTMNDMLGRVDDAARRQQQFLADASHELRSPLTRVRTELEVDLAHPEDADLLATHRSVLDETVGLQRLAEDLLLVARGDAGAASSGREEPVDLDDLVLRVARRIRAGERVAVDLAGVGAAQVRGDPDLLARAVGNLADNAVRHATSTVRFELAEVDGAAVLSVADDGPGVPDADRARIFERFARLDEARGSATGGTGLGLAIARDVAERHGGTLVLADDGPGARFVLTLPTAQQDL